MATQSQSFTRSNVNAATLNVSDPKRSSFNLSHKVNLTMPIGRCVPVQMEPLMPSDVLQGSLSPELQFEKILTPQIGPVRLDTHTFVVNMRRINKDFKNGLSDDKPIIPVFDYSHYFGFFFGMLIYAGWNKTTGDYNSSVPTGTVRNLTFTLADFAYPSSKSDSAPKLLKDASQHIYKVLYYGCQNLLSAVEQQKFYYRKDSVLTYMQYLEKSPWYNPTAASPDSDPLDFLRSLLYLVKPFFGDGSLLDYLGYPVFTEYSAFFDSWRQMDERTYSLANNALLAQFVTTSTLSPLSVYGLFVSEVGSIDSVSYAFTLKSLDLPSSFSELPLRAYYACWFDYLRNWHIEGRNEVLNPDNFGNALIVPDSTYSAPASFNAKVPYLASLWSILDLQYRNYTTDFLNSIQTDDDFRHVYSPVLGPSSTDGAFNEKEMTALDMQDHSSMWNGVTPDYIDSINSGIFPSGVSSILSSFSTTSEWTDILHQDLQTMRRVGMLEKWLARNYYYPDNYVGRIQARFGIKPSDYNVLLSTYIGGSEQFISGDQKVANVGTDQTPVGQRTMVANAASSDSFSYQSSDWAFLVSFVSLVPIVNYDIAHPATLMSLQQDFPSPEYATDARFEARTADFLRGFSIKPCIGYVPRYYMWRVRGDETHGRYLTDLRSYSWFKDWYSMFFGSSDDKDLSSTFVNHEFSLTPYHFRVHVSLDAFLGLNDWDPCAFGSVNVGLSINRPLPAAVEYI